MKPSIFIVILSLLFSTTLFCQQMEQIFPGPQLSRQPDNQYSYAMIPYGSLPLGSSSDVFDFGGGVDASFTFIPEAWKYFGTEAVFDYLFLPLESYAKSDNAVWTVSASAGPVFRYPLNDRLSLFSGGQAGYYYWNPGGGWDADDSNGSGLVLSADAGVLFRIAGPFTLGTGVSYDYYNNLYNGVSFHLAVHLDYPELKREGLDLDMGNIRLIPLFPVLYSYYGSNPIGTINIRNTSNSTAENIDVEFFVEQYMDNPMPVCEPFQLKAGEERTVELFALFTDDLLEITEGTKVSARIMVNRSSQKKTFSKDITGILEFYNRNALSWNDDRRIASFITAKDPEIMNFSKNVMTWIKESQNPAIDENLQKGMAVFEAVKNYGIRYEIDPTTPFSEFSEETEAIDFLQFPRQTLQYTNGDCDDLTALYTSLLESVGVETAFVTVPGHIYAAFALKCAEDEAPNNFSDQNELIFLENKAWIPVEITMFQESFDEAWATGAKEWRENKGKEQAVLYPVREAWKLYQAVGFREGEDSLRLPDKQGVTSQFVKTINRFVRKEIQPRLNALQQKLVEDPNDMRTRNRIAVLHARYGLYEEAEENFRAALSQLEYAPALTNLGNILYLRKQYEEALGYYQRAAEKKEHNWSALLGITRCAHELENYYLSKKTFDEIKELNPDLAEKYAYLDLKGEDATRAADASGIRDTMLWEEEE